MVDERIKRFATGAVIAVAAYGILLLSTYTWLLQTATALLCAATAYEILQAAGISRKSPVFKISVSGAALLAIVPIPGYFHLLCIVLPLVFGFFIWMMAHVQQFRLPHSWQHMAVSAGIVLLLRAFPVLGAMEHGRFYLLMAVTACFLTDVFAYHVGKRMGRRKLAPVLSPHKTVEGAVGGTVLTVIALGILKPVFTMLTGSTCSLGIYSLYVLLLSVAAQLGDLSMSALKRIDGVKDYGTLLPGHGGILDRFDSHIFAVALLTVLLILFPGFAVPC